MALRQVRATLTDLRRRANTGKTSDFRPLEARLAACLVHLCCRPPAAFAVPVYNVHQQVRDDESAALAGGVPESSTAGCEPGRVRRAAGPQSLQAAVCGTNLPPCSCAMIGVVPELRCMLLMFCRCWSVRSDGGVLQEAERVCGVNSRSSAAGGPCGSCGEPGICPRRSLRPEPALSRGVHSAAAVTGRRRRLARPWSACCFRLCSSCHGLTRPACTTPCGSTIVVQGGMHGAGMLAVTGCACLRRCRGPVGVRH